jgi:TonB family protein
VLIGLLLVWNGAPAMAQDSFPNPPPRPFHDCPRPNLPKESLLRREQGLVVIQFDLDQDGRPENLRVVKSTGYWRLDLEGIKTLKHCFIQAPGAKGLKQEFEWRLE